MTRAQRLISWRCQCKGDGHNRGRLSTHDLRGPGGWVGTMYVTCDRANKIVKALNRDLSDRRKLRGVTP